MERSVPEVKNIGVQVPIALSYLCIAFTIEKETV
jgi:hypothetical protein